MTNPTFPLDKGYHITLTDQHMHEDEQVVIDGLTVYNRAAAEHEHYTPLNLFIRDEGGAIKGGLLGATYWGWCAINILWLHDDLRGKGCGTRLMQIAEEEAIKRGCHGIHLDTTSFQALPFYQKLGYIVFGQIDDFPIGHARYYLKKSLK